MDCILTLKLAEFEDPRLFYVSVLNDNLVVMTGLKYSDTCEL
jgi:hypothetical protein